MKNTLLRTAISALASITTCISAQALAQAYPSRNVTIVVPLAAGTGLDIVARVYAERLSQALGKPVVIDNTPGGSHIVAINAAKALPNDGHTLLVQTSAGLAINPALFKTLPYNPVADFTPISLYVKSPFILIVSPSLPVKTVNELIAYAKERPGKLSYSSPGIGTAPHLAGAMLNQRFGLDIAHVPYKNTPQSISDVSTGLLQLGFAEAGASQSMIRDGRLRALGISSLTRSPVFPDIAPLAEVSGVADFEAVSWHTLIARSGTPPEIINRLHDEMGRIMKTPEVRERIAGLGLIPIDSMSQADIQQYYRSEAEKWGTLVKKLGLEGSQ